MITRMEKKQKKGFDVLMFVKRTIESYVEVQETDTQGNHSYVVALLCGGVMEDPELYYEQYQIIHADSESEALKKYREINGEQYYKPHVLQIIK